MACQKVGNLGVSARREVPHAGETAPGLPRNATGASLHRPAGRWTREFDALLRVRETVLLHTDSEGILRSIVVPDPSSLSSLTGMLTGRSLVEILDREIYPLFVEACRNARRFSQAQELGCLFLGLDHPRWLSVLINSTQHPRRNLCRVQILFHDPASRARMHVRTRPDSSPIDRAIALGKLATWEADFRTGEVTCSERLLEIAQAFEPALPACDLIWMIARDCYHALSANSHKPQPESFEQDVQFWGSDGRPRVVHARTLSIAQEQGLPLHMAGVIEDVSDQKAFELRARNQAALLSSAERLGNLGTWELDLQTGQAVWSGALFDILGLPRAGDSNQAAYLRNLHPEDRARVPQILAHAVCSSSPCEYTWRYRTGDGDWHVYRTLAAPVQSLAGARTHVVGVVGDITEQTRVAQELHSLSQSLIRARDQERRTLARELHESAGQSLAALKMTLGNLWHALRPKDVRIRALVESCQQLTDAIAGEIRTVSYLMHPPMLDESGLVPAVRWYARGFTDRSKIKVSVDASENFGRLSKEIEMTAFRLIQEALTNVHRYSGSRTARIRLVRDKRVVLIEIADAGCGLPGPIRSDAHHSEGVGIASMRERVHELDGIFEIETAPGRGTSVRAIFPERLSAPANCNLLAEAGGEESK
ncbi:MAG: PAS domain-containing protein [Candidatus Acidiferrales bacterium]